MDRKPDEPSPVVVVEVLFERYLCPCCGGRVPRKAPRRVTYCSRACWRKATARHNHMIWIAAKGWKEYYQSGRAGRSHGRTAW
jgi:hypothetical protein